MICKHPTIIPFDTLIYTDTEQTYKELTEFRPMVSTVQRSLVLIAICPFCGETFDLLKIQSNAESNLEHSEEG